MQSSLEVQSSLDQLEAKAIAELMAALDSPEPNIRLHAAVQTLHARAIAASRIVTAEMTLNGQEIAAPAS